jgi:hypothetical protein
MPDFGIFRGFNEKLFGDKLYAGQLPTQLGLIGSSDVDPFDIDAKAFFDRVIAAGGTLSATEKTAVNTLVLQMKTDLIWTKMKAIYPMVGASAAACAQNLKSSSFTGIFNGGWTFASTGVTPNGTNAFFNTNFNESSNLTSNSVHLSFYSRTTVGVGFLADMGVVTFTGFFSQIGQLNNTTSEFAAQSILTSGSRANTNTLGLFLSTRQVSTEFNSFIRNIKVIHVIPSQLLANIPYYIGARNFNNSGNGFSNKECAFSSMGDGLTDDNADKLHNAVQAFQTTLSRQV